MIKFLKETDVDKRIQGFFFLFFGVGGWGFVLFILPNLLLHTPVQLAAVMRH